MTRDDLLELVTTSFSQRAEATQGGFLICHTPRIGDLAYLGRVFDPIPAARVRDWSGRTPRSGNPYFSFVTEVANGLRIANLDLFGVVEQLDRSVEGIGQPISLYYGNLVARPANLDDSDMVIGGMVGWSSRGAFVMRHDGSVCLVHSADGSDVADEWPDLEHMLQAELGRLGALHDADGYELSSATELMHANGRRWETEIEPGSTTH